MKLCARAEKIKDSYRMDIVASGNRAADMMENDNIPQANASQHRKEGAQRAMARALNDHMARCKECG